MKYRYRESHEMKDSEVEWLGLIPNEWKVSKIGQYFQVRSEKVSDVEYPALSVSKNGIVPQMESVAKTDNNDNRKKVCINDFVINSRADRKGSCGVSKLTGSVSLIAHVLKISEELDPGYIHYLFRNYYFSEEFYRWGTGIVDDLWSTNIERMKKINIPFFLKEEQRKIVNFLDKKCEEFDSIITKKELLINKLEESKKSLISEVITGKIKIVEKDNGKYGIIKRETYEMKDSGVEWLGMIPNEWETKKLGYLFSFKNGVNADASKYGKGIKFINIKEIINNRVLTYDMISSLVDISRDVIKENIVKNGDILLNRTSETAEEIGLVAVYKDNNPVVFGGFVIKGSQKSKTLIDIFKKYCFNSFEIRSQMISYASGSIRKNISQSNLKNIFLTYPKIVDQEIIGKYLEKKCFQFDIVIEKQKESVEKLKLAKQSLISEVVTGKIEVL